VSRLWLAWLQVRTKSGQLAVAGVVIALGVALSCGMLLATERLSAATRDSLRAMAGEGELQLSARGGGMLDEALVERVVSSDGVAAAAPLLLGAGSIGEAKVSVVGMDMLSDANRTVFGAGADGASIIGDPLVFMSQNDSALVTSSLAERAGLEAGEAFEIDLPMGRRRLTVRGILATTESMGQAGMLVLLDLPAAQEVLDVPGRVSQIHVAAVPGWPADRVGVALRAHLPGHVAIETLAERTERVERIVTGMTTTLNAFAALALVLAAVITANRLRTLYDQRMAELATLRSMGWSARALASDLVVEAGILSTVATLVGLPIGIGFSRLLAASVERSVSLGAVGLEQVATGGTPIWDTRALVLSATVGILSGVVAAAWPAVTAARASIMVLQSGRSRRAMRPDGRAKRIARRLLPALAAVVLLAALTLGDSSLAALAVGLVTAAAILAILPLLAGVTRLVRSVSPGSAASVGLSDQSRAPSRAVGAATLLIVGVGLSATIGAMASSFEHFVVESLMRARQADLVIDAAANATFGAIGANEAALSERVVDELRAVPGVASVGAEAFGYVGDPEMGVLALDPERLTNEAFGRWPLKPGAASDALELVAQGRAVLVGETLAPRLDARVGATVRVATPDGPLDLPVAGIVETTTFLAPSGDVVIARDPFRKLWGNRQVNRIFVLAKPGTDVAVLSQDIEARLGERYALRVMATTGFRDWLADNVRQGFGFSRLLIVATLLVVALGAGDALMANVHERSGEIAVLRSCGYDRRSIVAMIVAQAAVIGVVGVALATLYGLAISSTLVIAILPDTLRWQVPYRANPGNMAVGAVAGLLAVVASAAWPAWRAASTEIGQILRKE